MSLEAPWEDYASNTPTAIIPPTETPEEPWKVFEEEQKTLAESDDFDHVIYAAEHPESVESMFHVEQKLNQRTFKEKAKDFAAGAGRALLKPETYGNLARGVSEFMVGLAAPAYHTVSRVGHEAGGAVSRALGREEHAEMSEKEALRHKAEAVLAGQNIETNLRNAGRIGGNLAVKGMKLLAPEGSPMDMRQVTDQQKEETDRADFLARVETAKKRSQLAQSRPIDEDWVAKFTEITEGIKPSEAFSPEALEAAGAPPIRPFLVGSMAAGADPLNLLLRPGMSLPGARQVTGAAMEAGGALAQAPGAILGNLPGRGIGRGVSAGAALGEAVLTQSFPVTSAKVMAVAVAAKGLQKVGKLLQMQGKELRTGQASPLTTRIATKRAAGESVPLKDTLARTGADVLGSGGQAAIGLAPLNLALSEGDPEEFIQLEGIAGTFGGLHRLGAGGRRMLIEGVRPFLRSEGARTLDTSTLLGEKSARFVMSLPDSIRDRIFETIGMFQGMPTEVGGKRTDAKVYVLSHADYLRQVAKIENRAQDGGDGFAVAEDGTAFIDGERTTAQGNTPETLGHEVGGHIGPAIVQAMGRKGAPLWNAVVKSTLDGLYEKGKPTPDFQKFIDSYNRAYDPTGETKRLDPNNPEAVEEFVAETAGKILAGEGAANLALPETVLDKINRGVARFGSSLLGIDTREAGGRSSFNLQEVGIITQSVREMLRGIADARFRGPEGPEAVPTPPEAQKPATGNVAPARGVTGIPVTGIPESITVAPPKIGQATLDALRDYHVAGLYPPLAQRANTKRGIPGKSADKVAEEKGAEFDQMAEAYLQELDATGANPPANSQELYQAIIQHALRASPESVSSNVYRYEPPLATPRNEPPAEKPLTSRAPILEDPALAGVPDVAPAQRDRGLPETDQVALARAANPEGPVREAIDTLDANRGKVVWVKDYKSAVKGQEGFSEAERSREIAGTPAGKRKTGAESELQDKPFIISEIRVNADGEPYATGFDVDVMLSNLRHVKDAMREAGVSDPLPDDQSITKTLENYIWNQNHGFDGAGTRRLAKPGPGYRLPDADPDASPRLLHSDPSTAQRIADMLNMAVNSKVGEIGKAEGQKAMALNLENQGFREGTETNQLRRDLIEAGFDVDQELSKRSAFYGRLSLDLMQGGIQTTPEGLSGRSVRPHGFDLDLPKAFAAGKPQFEAVAAGFRPKEEDAGGPPLKDVKQEKKLISFPSWKDQEVLEKAFALGDSSLQKLKEGSYPVEGKGNILIRRVPDFGVVINPDYKLTPSSESEGGMLSFRDGKAVWLDFLGTQKSLNSETTTRLGSNGLPKDWKIIEHNDFKWIPDEFEKMMGEEQDPTYGSAVRGNFRFEVFDSLGNFLTGSTTRENAEKSARNQVGYTKDSGFNTQREGGWRFVRDATPKEIKAVLKASSFAGFRPKEAAPIEEKPLSSNVYRSKKSTPRDALRTGAPLSSKFRPTDSQFRPKTDELGFYSELRKAVEEKLPDNATPKQIMAALDPNKSGVKKEEVEWLGVSEFMEGKESVSKKELLDFLDSNKVEIKEVVKGGQSKEDAEAQYRRHIEELYAEARQDSRNDDIDRSDLLTQLRVRHPQDEFDFLAERNTETETKFGTPELNTPGGTNYKEFLYTLPPENKAYDSALEAFSKVGRSRQEYKSPHWDEPNVLAHTREADHVDVDGNKVRLVEEVQSDWHLEGRKKGYENREGWTAIENIKQPGSQTWQIRNPQGEVVGSFAGENANEAIGFAVKKHSVPDAPFKTSWYKVLMKRSLRRAVEDGMDKLAWTTGEQQIDRYDLSKQVDWLSATHNKSKDTYTVAAGKGRDDSIINQEGITPDKLEGVVGKDMAIKIRTETQVEGKTRSIFRGTDLKVGGEGKKILYDQTIPEFMRRYVKQWGGKVETTRFSNPRRERGNSLLEENNLTREQWNSMTPEERNEVRVKSNTGKEVHSVTITDAMRSAVKEGQPLFRPIEQSPAEKEDLAFRIGTRKPWATKALGEDPATLTIGLESILQDKSFAAKVADTVKSYDYVPTAKGPGEVLESFIEHTRGNLVWLHDQIPDKIRSRSKLWYDGARNITTKWASDYELPRQGVAAVIASLSPQRDWFMNLSLAKRVLDVYTQSAEAVIDSEMLNIVKRLSHVKDLARATEAMKGKKFKDLSVIEKAIFTRLFDEAHNERSFSIVSPEGNVMEIQTIDSGAPAAVTWSSFAFISKAIAVLENSSPESIHKEMGNAHKVRNFYNNILLPNSSFGDVTIDTHAVAAGLLTPLGGTHPEVGHNFDKGPTNAKTGSMGTYGLYAEAYRRAAADRKVLPREMQSITWEAVRGLFDKGQKMPTGKKLVTSVWKQYVEGKITIDEARNQILELSGGINPPDWAGPRPGITPGAGRESDQGALSKPGLSGKSSRGTQRGGRGVLAGVPAD